MCKRSVPACLQYMNDGAQNLTKPSLSPDFGCQHPPSRTHAHTSTCYVRFEVLTVVTMKVAVFWDITCRLSVIYQYFRRTSAILKHVPPKRWFLCDHTASHSGKQWYINAVCISGYRRGFRLDGSIYWHLIHITQKLQAIAAVSLICTLYSSLLQTH
jgi:hypothetical protein